ncbi:MAG: Orotidine 5'-phosphate decarboxylase [Candidatus Roizmanbacteria bacterium GW2011_GWA2_32_13]|uniref:Orotidine-5'-phosphate decarboxylase n=1 Tax=Candidatus Roizmanbacteria bacterium GW2011_GWA2_32_13 TaxID=1618475 RepID=A0A0F9YVC5_9BACT|nr:MAG: Orotidine 5'-phosphate decarboxylase [Candidatus Roizmanbacteria bacterium GW2011_GWA2_32_13]
MTFQEKLDKIVEKNKSLVCVGLDQNQLSFNKTIIEATHDLVCSYKLNTAFYESIGHKGIKALKDTCDYLKEKYPEIPIIIDAKRADIGNTNKGYVQFVFTYLGADAVTVHPYLGEEAIRPFLNIKDKGVIILCRTSNSGAGEFQDLKIDGTPLYKIVAKNVSSKWNTNKNCMLVVGATYPQELKEVRSIVGDMTLLVPGIGAQGGDLEATLKAGLNSKKQGLIINSSRGIIFAKNPRVEAMKLRNEINKIIEKLS